MKLDVLAIGAHPDDVELACGGAVAKLVKQGKKVGICDLTRGELGSRGSAEIRAAEAAEAARILGVSVRENLHLTDGNIEITPENRLKVITTIRKYRPDILLFPHWFERHPDHEAAHRLCRESWFFAGLEKIETRLDGGKQQAYRPPKYYLFMQSYEYAPSFVLDITSEFDLRMKAVRAYKSQFHDPSSDEPETFLSKPEFFDILTTRFKYFGSRIGVRYAEPFYSVDMIGVDDLSSLVKR